MLRGNARLRIRYLSTAAILLAAVLGILAAIAYSISRVSVLKTPEVQDRAPEIVTPMAVPPSTVREAVPPEEQTANGRFDPWPALIRLGLVPEDVLSGGRARNTGYGESPYPASVFGIGAQERELSVLTGRFVTLVGPSSPWFSEQTLRDLHRGLEMARQKGTAAPRDEALDPQTHAPDEIRATLCKAVITSAAMAELRKAARTVTVDQRNRTEVLGWKTALRGFVPCVDFILEGADSSQDPGVSLAAYLDAYRMSCLAGNAESIEVDTCLRSVLDAYPGSVPAAVADELLSTIEKPWDLEGRKRAFRDEAQQRSKRAATRRDSVFTRTLRLALLAPPSRTLKALTAPDPCAGIVETTEDALRLVETPPVRVSGAFQSVLRTVPKTAPETSRVVLDIKDYVLSYHRHLTMATLTRIAIALKQYKSDHGQYPATLDGLTPDTIPSLPTQPMEGIALVYERRDDGFAIGMVRTKDPSRPFGYLWIAKH